MFTINLGAIGLYNLFRVILNSSWRIPGTSTWYYRIYLTLKEAFLFNISIDMYRSKDPL